jgi:hypothetical protein
MSGHELEGTILGAAAWLSVQCLHEPACQLVLYSSVLMARYTTRYQSAVHVLQTLFKANLDGDEIAHFERLITAA